MNCQFAIIYLYIVYNIPYRRARLVYRPLGRVRARAKVSSILRTNLLYTRYPIVAPALGLAAAFRSNASREQRYLAYKQIYILIDFRGLIILILLISGNLLNHKTRI